MPGVSPAFFRCQYPLQHASDAFPVKGTFVEAVLEIVDTPNGERMRLTATRLTDNADVSVVIHRPGGEEKLPLLPRGTGRAHEHQRTCRAA